MREWLSRTLGRFGIDPVQLHALVRSGLKLDFRLHALTSGRSKWAPIVSQIVMFGMVGLLLGTFAFFVPDVFLSGSVAVSAVMFFIASAVLVEFAVLVISPLDYEILAYQPISSATYFAARLANVLFYTTAMTTAIALLPIGAFFLRRGFDPALGLAALAAFYLASTTTTLAVIVAYVGIAKRVRPDRLKRTFTYLQLVLSFTVYGAYFVLPSVFPLKTLPTLTIRKSPWMLLYPPTWFASLLALAAGRWSALEIVPAATAVGCALLFAWLTTARVSLGYSEMLGRQASASAGRQRARSRLRAFWLGRGEQRAIGLLMSAQFRHDQRFRLMVLSIVPLTILYLFIGVREGGLRDPFLDPRSPSNAFLLYFAMVMFPAMLITGIARSDAWRASWVFFVTPVRRARLILAVKNLALLYFLVPYLICVGAVLAWFFGSVLHALLHTLVQGLIVNLVLLAMVMFQPEMPFSRPMQKGQSSAMMFGVMLGGALVQGVSTHVLAFAVYPYPFVLAALMVGLLGAGVGGDVMLRRRLQKTTAAMEFAG